MGHHEIGRVAMIAFLAISTVLLFVSRQPVLQLVFQKMLFPFCYRSRQQGWRNASYTVGQRRIVTSCSPPLENQ